MKKNRFRAIALSISIAASSLLGTNVGFAQQTKILTAEKHNEYGLIYSLPITALRVTVTAQKETLIAGPYANYSKKYLAAENPIMESGEKWTILNVEVTPYGAVDPSARYLMQLKPGALTFLQVDRNGMLIAVNKETEPANEKRSQPAADASEQKYTGQEYLQYVDEDFIASQSKAKQAEMLAENLMEVRDAYLSLTRGTADTMPVDSNSN